MATLSGWVQTVQGLAIKPPQATFVNLCGSIG